MIQVHKLVAKKVLRVTRKTYDVSIDGKVIPCVIRGKLKSGLLDRYLIIAQKNNLNTLICIYKSDLANKKDFEIYITEYSKLGYGAFFGSVLIGEGFDWIKGILTGKVALFVEHSGVEKVL